MKNLWKTSDKSTRKQGRQGQVLWDSRKAKKEEAFLQLMEQGKTHSFFKKELKSVFPSQVKAHTIINASKHK